MDEYTVKLAGKGFSIAKENGRPLYEEILRTPLLERQTPELIDGTLDFGVGHPYSQRSWVLGEYQSHSHEHDEMKTASVRRYASGAGVENSVEGELTLLKALTRSKTVQSATLPMCVSKDGATIYAFPAGTDMHVYTAAGGWATEAITGVTSPVIDCISAGGDLYIIDSQAAGSRVRKRASGGGWSQITPHASFAATVFNAATAVAWTNGVLYVLSATALYDNTNGLLCSEWTGGTIMTTFAGAVYFSDGSNRVYLYNGQGTRLIMEDLPSGFQVQYLFGAHGRLWMCGQLPDSRVATYWYAQGQWGAHAFWPLTGTGYACKAGAATAEHVLFADAATGGIMRHYSPEGGISHHYAYGSYLAIPYKGITVGAATIAIAVYSADADIAGIYIPTTTYVTTGTCTGSLIDLAMPAHLKQWFTLSATYEALTAGQTIKLEISYDGGTTWTVLGTDSTLGSKSSSYQLTGTSYEAQWRVTLGSGATATTTPKVLSITLRGNPIVTTGRRWNIVLAAQESVGTLTSGRHIINANDRVDTLIDAALAQEPTDFVDIRGNTYTVVIRPYSGRPAINQHGFYQAGLVYLTLDQIDGD